MKRKKKQVPSTIIERAEFRLRIQGFAPPPPPAKLRQNAPSPKR